MCSSDLKSLGRDRDFAVADSNDNSDRNVQSFGRNGDDSGFAETADRFFRLPERMSPLAVMRPISGSGALAVYESILESVHPDSFAGRVASVILGSTETTFYTLAVYYGATNVKNTRHSLVSSLTADLTGFIFSALTVRLIMR